ncbi:septation protein SepH [Specibacter sp. NPDC057265]|uniref:septation protein SepH n=1 Tax=Specibacter sp. NPDC057265 TaxID=3346075 RepID=UPI0036314050
MADLRLVGVHDDGEHLLLSGTGGEIYLLPLDEALRTAVGRNTHRFARSSQPSGTKMSPREIQSLIRAGATAADVAEQAGLTIDQVRRYEGPVLAEREYIANQARNVQVAAPSSSTDGYRTAFGESPATLDDMVRHRLRAFGIDPQSLRWNAWRDQAGDWTVSADFEVGNQRAASSIGEPAPALWRFHAARKSLHNANRWAQQLSELEPLDSPVPERRLSAVTDQPFDVEAEATAQQTAPAGGEQPQEGPVVSDPGGQAHAAPGSSHGLLEMLRSRRGVRLGADEAGDDQLAAMLGTHVPGAHPRDETFYGAAPPAPPAPPAAEPTPEAPSTAREKLRSIPFLKLAPSLDHQSPAPLDTSSSVSEVSTQTHELVLSGEPATPAPSPAGAPQDTAADEAVDPANSAPSDSEVAARLERKAAAKPKRSSVPSWDEIVFGTKGD